jgi:glycerol-1-phosphate dehydrogenase [NAD(P)+]
MTAPRLPQEIYIGTAGPKHLAAFCAARLGLGGRACGAVLRLVADSASWAARSPGAEPGAECKLGPEVERELRAMGVATRATIYAEASLAADARSVFRLLIDADANEQLYVAIGSGTITDIVRFACHRTGRDFVSLATAPSVDAFASVVAPVLVDGIKVSVPAAAPLAVFADTEALALAPRPMIAAGFGDMLCKFSAVADWRLGALLWRETFDETIARRSQAAARACVEAVAAIGAAEPGGLATLMGALVESGLCMAQAGHSRSASGAEHQYSHYWEMRLLAEGRPPILHGLKVGIGTIEAARLWDVVRGMDEAEASARLARSALPDRAAEEANIRGAYAGAADIGAVIAGQERFLSMSSPDYQELKHEIRRRWREIRALASTVPSAAETAKLLAVAGCPTDACALGLGRRETVIGLEHAHYVRDRFTVKKLARLLAIA